MSQNKGRWIWLCSSSSWQVLGLRETPVRPDCSTTWRVQNLGQGMGPLGRLCTPFWWAEAPTSKHQSQVWGRAWLYRLWHLPASIWAGQQSRLHWVRLQCPMMHTRTEWDVGQTRPTGSTWWHAQEWEHYNEGYTWATTPPDIPEGWACGGQGRAGPQHPLICTKNKVEQIHQLPQWGLTANFWANGNSELDYASQLSSEGCLHTWSSHIYSISENHLTESFRKCSVMGTS